MNEMIANNLIYCLEVGKHLTGLKMRNWGNNPRIECAQCNEKFIPVITEINKRMIHRVFQ